MPVYKIRRKTISFVSIKGLPYSHTQLNMAALFITQAK